MTAEIINIGEELLIGQVVNTNASWISQKLNEAAIQVRYISVVSDDGHDIDSALKTAIGRSDLIIMTGGLGPTKDDITKEILVNQFNTKLEINNLVLDDIKKYFRKRSMDINELNYLQAMVPKGCEIIRNPEGTAPGLVFKEGKKIVIALPGVPYEMKYMIENYIIPELNKSKRSGVIFHKTVHTQGIPESFLAENLADWEDNLPKEIQLAYLPSAGTVRLRLTCKAKDREKANKIIKAEVAKLNKIIPDYIFGYDNDSLEEIIIKLMSEKKLTLGLAESCTGGYISHLLTSVPGSSICFKGSIVSYSNEVKTNQLYIPKDLIEKHGAVSKETAIAMAKGVREVLKVDYSIAVTGIAGPSGGTEKKPIGLVYIAISDERETICQDFLFGDKRERNIIRSSLTALNILRKQIKKADQ